MWLLERGGREEEKRERKRGMEQCDKKRVNRRMVEGKGKERDGMEL